MPPAPEFGDRRRLVRRVEVLREAEAQQQRDADGHVRIAREVAVDLQRVAVDAHQALEARVEQRLVENAVDEVQRDVVRDDRLLEESREDQEDPRAEHLARDDDRVPADLRDEVPRPHDRPRDQLREERQVKEVVQPVRQGFQLPAVDVDRVAHRLEDEERDPHRQEDVLELQETLSEELVRDVDQEVRVLEVAQHPEVHRHAQCHEPPFRPPARGAVDPARDQEVARRREDQQQEVDAARLVVEVERKEHHVDDTPHRGPAEGAVNEQEARKQEEEKPAAEYQRRGGVVGQQCLQLFPEAVRRGECHGSGRLRDSRWRAGSSSLWIRARCKESITSAAFARRTSAARRAA